MTYPHRSSMLLVCALISFSSLSSILITRSLFVLLCTTARLRSPRYLFLPVGGGRGPRCLRFPTVPPCILNASPNPHVSLYAAIPPMRAPAIGRTPPPRIGFAPVSNALCTAFVARGGLLCSPGVGVFPKCTFVSLGFPPAIPFTINDSVRPKKHSLRFLSSCDPKRMLLLKANLQTSSSIKC